MDLRASYLVHTKEERMLYFNNLPVWERWVRFVAGFAMVGCGLYLRGRIQADWLLLGAGVVTFLTGAIGFCPACALAGRRIAKRAKALP